MLVVLGVLGLAVIAVAARYDLRVWRRRRRVDSIEPHRHGYRPPAGPEPDFPIGVVNCGGG
jgi:hypothetical protein